VNELEQTLGRLLGRGTTAAGLVTTVGVALSVSGLSGGTAIAETGIAMFVALPVVRLAVLAAAFAQARERRLAAVAGLVLAIVVAGAVLGALTPGARG
jgi:uncharacterized membrane protein